MTQRRGLRNAPTPTTPQYRNTNTTTPRCARWAKESQDRGPGAPSRTHKAKPVGDRRGRRAKEERGLSAALRETLLACSPYARHLVHSTSKGAQRAALGVVWVPVGPPVVRSPPRRPRGRASRPRETPSGEGQALARAVQGPHLARGTRACRPQPPCGLCAGRWAARGRRRARWLQGQGWRPRLVDAASRTVDRRRPGQSGGARADACRPRPPQAEVLGTLRVPLAARG